MGIIRQTREDREKLKRAREFYRQICNLKKGERVLIQGDFKKLGEVLYKSPLETSRDTEDIEKYCLMFYLYALSHGQLLKLDGELLFSEHPDWTLFLPDKSIGLEVTKATTKSYQHVQAYAPDGSIIFFSHYYENTTSQQTVGNGIYKPGDPPSGCGFGNNGEENVWIRCMGRAIAAKTELLNKSHSEKHSSNELLIRDDAPVCPEIDLSYAVPELKRSYEEQIRKIGTEKTIFDKVHIVRKSFIYDVFGLFRTVEYQCRKFF